MTEISDLISEPQKVYELTVQTYATMDTRRLGVYASMEGAKTAAATFVAENARARRILGDKYETDNLRWEAWADEIEAEVADLDLNLKIVTLTVAP